MTFRSFYSACIVDGKYNNVEPEYKKLANFFMITIKKNNWVDGNTKFKTLTDLINDDYFKAFLKINQLQMKNLKYLEYKFLIFILFYNKIVDKEGKRFNNYEGNRKMINDIRLNLFGTTPLEGDWKTSIAGKIIKNGIGLAVNGSVRGILEDNTTLNNKLNNTIFDFNSNNKVLILKKRNQ